MAYFFILIATLLATNEVYSMDFVNKETDKQEAKAEKNNIIITSAQKLAYMLMYSDVMHGIIHDDELIEQPKAQNNSK